MEIPTESTIHLPVTCENCATPTPTTQKFCSQCSFPVNGTEEQQRSFRLMVSSRKRFLDAARDKVKSSKRIMFFLAACFLVLGLVIGFSMDDFATMISNLVLSLIYLILAAWCEKNPFGATLTALILYVTLILVGAVLEPSTIASGIILKIIVVTALVKGIRSAQEAQKYLAELEKLKAVPA